MWWNKKVEEKPELTEEQQIKKQKLQDDKHKVWETVTEAINNNEPELALKWLGLYERIKDYRWNF